MIYQKMNKELLGILNTDFTKEEKTERLHKLARVLLNEGKVVEAWKTLMSV
jgi:hypothetical protein